MYRILPLLWGKKVNDEIDSDAKVTPIQEQFVRSIFSVEKENQSNAMEIIRETFQETEQGPGTIDMLMILCGVLAIKLSVDWTIINKKNHEGL